MSMRKFFIFSLPRSGSSWLSVFLSGAGCYCYHEPLADGTFSAFEDRLCLRPELCAGAIDTSAYQLPVEVPRDFHKFVLVREPSQIQRSLKMKGWSMGNINSVQDQMLEAAGNAIQIEYSKLNDIKYLSWVWNQIVGTPFDSERAEYLLEMNIQRSVSAVIKRVAS